MLICVKSKHGCSSGMMSWNVIVMRLVCKDSNNVDSEIHYFKDGSIPLFCSVDLRVFRVISQFITFYRTLWCCCAQTFGLDGTAHVVLHFINSFCSFVHIFLTFLSFSHGFVLTFAPFFAGFLRFLPDFSRLFLSSLFATDFTF